MRQRNYCGLILAENNYVRLSSRKVACSSMLPPASTGNSGSRISSIAALAENNHVRLSSRKIACSSVLPSTSTGNPGSRISCIAALAENNHVRLSSRKVACSSVLPSTSTGNPGSVYSHCENCINGALASRSERPKPGVSQYPRAAGWGQEEDPAQNRSSGSEGTPFDRRVRRLRRRPSDRDCGPGQ